MQAGNESNKTNLVCQSYLQKTQRNSISFHDGILSYNVQKAQTTLHHSLHQALGQWRRVKKPREKAGERKTAGESLLAPF